MNKTAIKNYAIWARVQLIESAKQSAFEYEITENGENKAGLDSVGGRMLTKAEKEQRNQLINEINRKGFDQVMEEAAYTWFNRFIALRFMEVNGYLPSRVRVFTDESGVFKPELLKQAMTVELEGLDRTIVLNLLDKQDNEELYKYLLITQCNALNYGLPYMFEKISNWTEILFPSNLLRQDSVIGRLVSDIDVEDWADEVEIIGWFYQYYISEKHEEVIDPLHGKVIKKEDIPAATQLFTTDWVVRYILDNSLGRYWIERHPESQLAEKLTYFVTPKDGKIPTVNESILPEELKVLDPCVGSGHFLSYAFEILIEIYRECGWSDREAAKSIIENNIYGLDIDDRAVQLACFAVMMKARKYNRRIISRDTKLHIFAMQDSTDVSDELIRYISEEDVSLKNDLNSLRRVFNNAKEYGSIITVPQIDFQALYARVGEIEYAESDNLLETILQKETLELLMPLIQQAEILAGKYDVVVTNPPFMNRYSSQMKKYIGDYYEAFKGDLFSVFMYRNFAFCKSKGYSGFMTPMVWMFLKTYEPLRQFIIKQKSIITLIQFEYSAFEEATVPICSFVLKNGLETSNGIYFKLTDFRGGMNIQKIKVEEAIQNKYCGYRFQADQNDFIKVPGSPIAYWVSYAFFSNFNKHNLLTQYGTQKTRVCTGDNERFLRLWFEIQKKDMFYPQKWVPYPKGGSYRKWYGNIDYVINYENNGEELYSFKGAMPGDRNYHLKIGITWSALTSGDPSFRFVPKGCVCDQKGPLLYIYDSNNLYYLLGALNSVVAKEILKVVAPTLDYIWGSIAKVPVVMDSIKQEKVTASVSECIRISTVDWNALETSYGFRKNPLI